MELLDEGHVERMRREGVRRAAAQAERDALEDWEDEQERARGRDGGYYGDPYGDPYGGRGSGSSRYDGPRGGAAVPIPAAPEPPRQTKESMEVDFSTGCVLLSVTSGTRVDYSLQGEPPDQTIYILPTFDAYRIVYRDRDGTLQTRWARPRKESLSAGM